AQVIVHTDIQTMFGDERQLVPLAYQLCAGRRQTAGRQAGCHQLSVDLERRRRVRVVGVGLQETPVRTPQAEFQTLPPGVADVLEEQADRASWRDRKDVVSHLSPEQRQVRLNPRHWLRPQADLVIFGPY